MFVGDQLIPFSQAAKAVGVSAEQLLKWHREFNVPALRTFGQNWMAYQSWVLAVLASALPGASPDYRGATERWWAERQLRPVQAVGEVA